MNSFILYLYTYYRFIFFLLLMTFVFSFKIYRSSADNKNQSLSFHVCKWLLSFLLCSFFCFAVSYFDFMAFGNYAGIILFFVFVILSIVYCLFALRVSSLIARRILSFLHSCFWHQNALGIVIFLFLSVQFFIRYPERLNEWCAWSYAVDYSMGFASRMLIGTVLSALSLGHVSEFAATIFCIVSTLLLNGLIAVLLNAVIKKCDSSIRKAVFFLILCYILSPGSVASFWTTANWGRLELYNLIVTLVSVILFHKLKNEYMKYAALAVLNCINIAIYQGFLFLYFPIIFMVMAFHIFRNRQIHRKCLILGIGVCLITALAFLVFQFQSSIKFADVDDMVAALQNKCDIHIFKKAIQCEFFGSLQDLFAFPAEFLGGGDHPREQCIMLFVLMLPFLILSVYIICNAVQKELTARHFLIAPLVYCCLSLLFVVPQFLLTIDWGRWMIAVSTCVFFLIFYGLYIGNTGICDSAVLLNKFLSTQPYLAAFILLILGVMHKFEADDITFDFSSFLGWVATALQK